MRINHNIASLNTYRQLEMNQTQSAKSLEKLSSGLRINKAGDDAAGLAISEKMRGQIRGLDQASRNSQDGISMIQTAEGALSETHSILQRMRELATQASNSTNTADDRGEIQKEVNQLTSEVNRIGNTTEFNTQKLLNGGGKDASVTQKGSSIKIPSQLTGGEDTAITTSCLDKTYTVGAGFSTTTDDGKVVTFSLGGKDLSFTLNKNLTAANSTATQIGISDTNNAACAADAIERALNLAITADADLSSKYQVGTTSNAAVCIWSKALSFSNGKLTGDDAGSKASITYKSSIALSTTVAEAVVANGCGAHSQATIDFAGKDIADLKGTGFTIDGKKVDLYDSSDGDYKGDADFKVDLKGAGNAEAIVDKVVSALYNGSSASVTCAGVTAATGATFLQNIYASKIDSTKLLLTSKNSGTTGNALLLNDNSTVAVSNFSGSDKLAGETINSAKGLSDGQHTVTVSYTVAAATTDGCVGAVSTAFTTCVNTIAVAGCTALQTGTYRLVGATTGCDDLALQKLNSDGSTWCSVSGYSCFKLATGSNTTCTFQDLTVGAGMCAIGGCNLTSGSVYITNFSVSQQHFDAKLYEQGNTCAGASVTLKSGDTVTLRSCDGVGQICFVVGDVSCDLPIGGSTNITFNTSASGVQSETVGCIFSAKFQIGANTGQSFDMQVSDMRARSLGISGTSASGAAGGIENAKYTATKDITNGTDSEATEYALDLSTSENASAAIGVLDNAIKSVSAQRSQLGAYQNRLEHTINNLDTASENLTAAESRVRDTDMAKEMMNFSKNNILMQAAQGMMAQANQQPQGVLQLLR